MRNPVLRLAAAGALLLAPHIAAAQAVPVTVSHAPDGSWQLLRGGKPYFIRGAGGHEYLDALKAAGGNSVRTWGADRARQDLDAAQAHGLSVTLGIWLGHKEHGFRYDDPAQVAKQLATVRDVVGRVKDHPALLLWGLGNEAEVGEGDDYWKALEDVARTVKKADPNHPTMTVVAEIGQDGVKAKRIAALCPDIDILGVNSYGGLGTLPRRLKAAGWTKPYVVTEFGPSGQWEVEKTAWGAPKEPTSTQKAAQYAERYQAGVASQKGWCLGSYAFLWGSKVEATPTWYGLFLPDGRKLGAVDAMTAAWSGRPPARPCPEIRGLALDGGDQAAPGATVRATLDAADPAGLPLTARWVLREEQSPGAPGDPVAGGDARGAAVRLPDKVGAYRLYAYVDDGTGAAAVANVPILVRVPRSAADTAPTAKLPLVLYGAGAAGGTAPYVPAGWIGNAGGVRMDERCATNPHSGAACLKFEYTAKDGWAGVVWQSPSGDWGDRPGGWDVTGAKRLTFWARGETGGEVLSFQFGLLGPDKKFGDTAQGKLADVTLTRDWKQFSIPLAGKDLSRIKTGFAWVLAARGAPETFYLDDIRYE